MPVPSPSILSHCIHVATAATSIALWHAYNGKRQPIRADSAGSNLSCGVKYSPCLSRSCSPSTCPAPPPSCSERCPPPKCQPKCEEYPQCGPVELKLRQAHVFFKHSFITPMNLIPRMPQAEYDHTFVMREHMRTLFAFQKLDACTNLPVEYSEYQQRMEKKTLRGGSYPGALTSYGKDEMFLFGKQLRCKYMEALNLRPYDPNEVSMLSTNVRRTVESARCVLAGMYSKYCLGMFACEQFPVPIYVTNPLYNILIPDIFTCQVLKDVNHAAMAHPDFIPDIKEIKDALEGELENERDEKLCKAQDIQSKIDSIYDIRQTAGIVKPLKKGLNNFRQPVKRDEEIFPLLIKRAEAFEKIPCFWHDVFCHHNELCKHLTDQDFKGLKYLRGMEVEEFEEKFQKGYRYTFYFDSNPYFHNKTIQKEVYVDPICGAKCSKETKIEWKLCGECLVPGTPSPCCGSDGPKSPSQCIMEEKDMQEFDCNWSIEDGSTDDFLDEDEAVSIPACLKTCGDENDASLAVGDCEQKADAKETGYQPCGKKDKDPRQLTRMCPEKCRRPRPPCPPPTVSFFTWLTKPTREKCDIMGKTIREEIWPDPLKLLNNEPTGRCLLPENHFDFVGAWNDIRSRIATGIPVPAWLKKNSKCIEENATKLLYYSVTGQTPRERRFVTRLAAGPLLETIVNRIKLYKDCGKGPRLCLYSCHDSTIVALLEALDIYDEKWPKFGANLTVEVYEDINSANYFIKVFYNNEEKIIRCTDNATVKWCDFQNALRPFTIKEDIYFQLCAGDTLRNLNPCLLKHSPGCDYKGPSCKPSIPKC